MKGWKYSMNKRKISFFSIVLYILGGLLFIYTIWGAIYSHDYISKAISAGQLTAAGHEYEIIDFYMSNCALYALFAIAFFALGCILNKCSLLIGRDPEPRVDDAVSEKTTDDEEERDIQED